MKAFQSFSRRRSSSRALAVVSGGGPPAQFHHHGSSSSCRACCNLTSTLSCCSSSNNSNSGSNSSSGCKFKRSKTNNTTNSNTSTTLPQRQLARPLRFARQPPRSLSSAFSPSASYPSSSYPSSYPSNSSSSFTKRFLSLDASLQRDLEDDEDLPEDFDEELEELLSDDEAPLLPPNRGKLRYNYDGLLQSLRLAASSGQFDIMDWKRLREEIADSAPHLSPKQLSQCLEGLAALRSVESQYLDPVMTSLRRCSEYMTGAQQASSLVALSHLSRYDSRGLGSAITETKTMQVLAEKVLTSLSTLPPSALLPLFAAVLKTQLLTLPLLQALLGSLPSGRSLSTSQLLEASKLLHLASERNWDDDVGEAKSLLRSVFIDVKNALRGRLMELSDEEMLRFVLTSVRLDALLDSSAKSPSGSPRKTQTLADLVSNRSREQEVVGDGKAFARLLLVHVRDVESAVSYLHPREAVTLLAALTTLSTAERLSADANRAESTSWRPSKNRIAYVLRFCPVLASHLTKYIDLLLTEDLLVTVESLGVGLRYEDDHLADILVEALRPRVLPLWPPGAPREALNEERLSNLLRALEGFSWQRGVAFSELLAPLVDELEGRITQPLPTDWWEDPTAAPLLDVLLLRPGALKQNPDPAKPQDVTKWLGVLNRSFRKRSLGNRLEEDRDSLKTAKKVLRPVWGVSDFLARRAMGQWLRLRDSIGKSATA